MDPETNYKAYRRVIEAMDDGLVRACHDCSEGGLALAAAEMSFTGDLGLDLDISKVPVIGSIRDDFVLFSESNGRLLLEIPANKIDKFENTMKDTPRAVIGSVKMEPKLTVMKGETMIFEKDLDTLIHAWKTPLEGRR